MQKIKIHGEFLKISSHVRVKWGMSLLKLTYEFISIRVHGTCVETKLSSESAESIKRNGVTDEKLKG